MTTQYRQLSVDLSQSPMLLATTLNTFFNSLGFIDLQWVHLVATQKKGSPNTGIELAFDPGGSVRYTAASFQKSAVASAEDLANAYLVANPTFQLDHVLDISSTLRTGLLTDALLIITHVELFSRCDLPMPLLPAIAQAQILSGAVGTVEILTAAGAAASPILTVTNGSHLDWPLGDAGWVLKTPGTCDWIGYPSFCSAP